MTAGGEGGQKRTGRRRQHGAGDEDCRRVRRHTLEDLGWLKAAICVLMMAMERCRSSGSLCLVRLVVCCSEAERRGCRKKMHGWR